jgi:hypothetical protein
MNHKNTLHETQKSRILNYGRARWEILIDSVEINEYPMKTTDDKRVSIEVFKNNNILSHFQRKSLYCGRKNIC